MVVKDLGGACPRQENNGQSTLIGVAKGCCLVAGYGVSGAYPREGNRENAGKETQRKRVDRCPKRGKQENIEFPNPDGTCHRWSQKMSYCQRAFQVSQVWF